MKYAITQIVTLTKETVYQTVLLNVLNQYKEMVFVMKNVIYLNVIMIIMTAKSLVPLGVKVA